ncbi:MAG: TadE/TadG family type IV pilus assembly protein, partial [Propioniciclava sp.]
MKRDERGSAAVEAVIGVPALLLLVGLLVLGGRTAIAQQAVQA